MNTPSQRSVSVTSAAYSARIRSSISSRSPSGRYSSARLFSWRTGSTPR
jgi:hypothetical protein